MYPEHITKPMEEELTSQGFIALKSIDQVNKVFEDKNNSFLILVNSVCGCAAGGARPACINLTNADKKPTNFYTVFAGVDTDAVKEVRDKLVPFPPSSPCIALFKDNKLVHLLERHHIEGNSVNDIEENLKVAFEQYC